MGNYDFFGWRVPNDALPLQAGDRIARSDARVHLAICRHDGPTSKGDCLNSTSNAMAGYEQRHGIESKIVVIHETEDLVHRPCSSQLVFAGYQMVPVPVLPLATGLGEWTHAVSCDEFAQFQLKDSPCARRWEGFCPPKSWVPALTVRAPWRACGRRTAAIFSILIA